MLLRKKWYIFIFYITFVMIHIQRCLFSESYNYIGISSHKYLHTKFFGISSFLYVAGDSECFRPIHLARMCLESAQLYRFCLQTSASLL